MATVPTSRIQASTLTFLADLEAHNEKPWFHHMTAVLTTDGNGS